MLKGACLFIVDGKGDSDLRVVGPLGVEALFAVALEVSGEVVVGMRGVDFRHGNDDDDGNINVRRSAPNQRGCMSEILQASRRHAFL